VLGVRLKVRNWEYILYGYLGIVVHISAKKNVGFLKVGGLT